MHIPSSHMNGGSHHEFNNHIGRESFELEAG